MPKPKPPRYITLPDGTRARSLSVKSQGSIADVTQKQSCNHNWQFVEEPTVLADNPYWRVDARCSLCKTYRACGDRTGT